jgi:signal transduction histidine kinase
MEDCGQIEVTYRVHPRPAATAGFGDRLLIGPDESVLEVNVTDTGPGIPEEHRDQIFSPFFTTRSTGNGLGLAVVWKAMKAHGGDIIAENRTECGACFRLLLPVKLDAANWER